MLTKIFVTNNNFSIVDMNDLWNKIPMNSSIINRSSIEEKDRTQLLKKKIIDWDLLDIFESLSLVTLKS
jgi:hypothetical protein